MEVSGPARAQPLRSGGGSLRPGSARLSPLRFIAAHEGSTRQVALLRIAFALLAWARWAALIRPRAGMSVEQAVVMACFFVSTTALLFGYFSRTAAAAAGVTLLYVYYAWGVAAENPSWMHHHQYLQTVVILLLALAPSGASYSVDRALAVHRARQSGAPEPEERGPLFAVRLIALQLSVVYVFSALDKTTWAFLSGDRLQHYYARFYGASDTPSSAAFEVLTAALAVAVVGLEYALGLGLFVRRLQRFLIPAGLLLHGVFYLALPVGTFSVACAAIYLAYLDPEDVHRFTEGPRRREAPP